MSVLYRDHFEFTADPFGITPDTGFFFGGAQRADILEALAVTIMHDEGIVMVVGEIGMGKTMLSRMLLERLKTMQVDTVYLPNPVFDRNEILNAIAKDLTGAAPIGSRAEVLGVLEPLLIRKHSEGRRVVVVVDEAHSMPAPTLEEIRLLSNLETSHHKLLKIMMFGQPELEQLLKAPNLRQVRDRVSHRFVLRPLTSAEVAEYLDFRLQRAGRNRGQLFSADAQALLAYASGGRTRRVNMLADKSLLAAYADGAEMVQLLHARAACAEEGITLSPLAPTASTTPTPIRTPARSNVHRWRSCAFAAFLGTIGLASGWWLGRQEPAQHQRPEPQVAAVNVAPEQSKEATLPTAPAPALPVTVAAASASVTALPPQPESQSTTRSGEAAITSPVASTRTAAEAHGGIVTNLTPVAELVSRTEDLIAKRRATGFTIQVLAIRAPQPDQLLEYLERYQQEVGSVLPVLTNDRIYGGIPHHAVYIGHFESREQAQSAMDKLPPALQAGSPLIRSFANIAKEPRP